MPPKRSTRSASVAKKTPSKSSSMTRAQTTKVTKSATKKRATTPVTTSTRTTRSAARREGSVASTDLGESVAGNSTAGSPEPPTAFDSFETVGTIETIEEEETAETSPSETAFDKENELALVPFDEEENAIQTIESAEQEESDERDEHEQEQDGMQQSTSMSMPISLERVLDGPASLLQRLTVGDKQDLILSMRDEIIRLRKTVEEMNQKVIQQAQSPMSPASPVYVRKTIDRSRDLRFQISIAQPAAILAAAHAEIEQKAEQARREQEEEEEAAATAAANAAANTAAVTPSKRSTKSPLSLSRSSTLNSYPIFNAGPDKPQTPEQAQASASPWGLRTMFSSVKRVFGRGATPSQSQSQFQSQSQSHTHSQSHSHSQSQSQDSFSQESFSQESPSRNAAQSRSEQQSQRRLEASSRKPSSPDASQAATPSVRSRRQQNTAAAPKTPTQETSETPVKSVRRRGQYPGSVSRTPRHTSTPPPKPVEPNADKRAISLEQAAERKRINERAEKLEEEKRKAEQKLDDQDNADHQVGGKRKRVRVDDLKAIPARLPGDPSGTFSFREEFFIYDSDEEGDDFVEMDAEEAEELVISRPAKRMRIEDNVFQSVTPQKPAHPSSFTSSTPSSSAAPSTPMPSTPAPSLNQQNSAALERQRSQASQHKPKRPSGLRQVSTGPSPATAGQTPRQISAATPAPSYYATPGPLGDITEITEPSETPVPSRSPVNEPITPAPVAAAPVAATPAPSSTPSTTFNFPAGVDLWVAYPQLYTKTVVEEALRTPLSKERIRTASKLFAIGCSERKKGEEVGMLSRAILPPLNY